MGRIEEALRRAKAERSGVTRRVAPNKGISGSSPEQHGEPGRGPSAVPSISESHVIHADTDRLQEERVIATSAYDERVGPYRQLRTQLLKTMRDNGWSTLAITSPDEGAGKSLTATNLAISLSRDVNTTVLLVDLDLTTPTIHKKLGLPVEKGLVDYLENNAELDDILFDPGIESLTVLAGRSAGREASELLATPKMQDLIRDLCQQGEANVTIFDLPPLHRNDDAMLFAPFADATLIVVEDGVTTDERLRQSIRLLNRANIIGTILNKARDW